MYKNFIISGGTLLGRATDDPQSLTVLTVFHI